MEQLKNEQTETLTPTAEAEKIVEGENKIEVSLGKFKDVQSLLSAYGALEAEFTKRCQKIKQLESELGVSSEKTKIVPEETEVAREQPREITKEEKEKILKEYLTSVLGRKQTAIVMDGGGVGVKTPKTRPKTLSEAGALAKELFNK